jgi:hypothetical protein
MKKIIVLLFAMFAMSQVSHSAIYPTSYNNFFNQNGNTLEVKAGKDIRVMSGNVFAGLNPAVYLTKASATSSGADIVDITCESYTVPTTGTYLINYSVTGRASTAGTPVNLTGKLQIAGLTIQTPGQDNINATPGNLATSLFCSYIGNITAGQIVDVRASCYGAGTRVIFGDDFAPGSTSMTIVRIR